MEVISSCWELTRLPKGQHGLAQPWDPSSLAMFLASIFHLYLQVLPLEGEDVYPCIGWRRHRRQTGFLQLGPRAKPPQLVIWTEWRQLDGVSAPWQH